MSITLSLCVRFKLECALFREYMDQLQSFLRNGDLDLPIVIVQFAKVKCFIGDLISAPNLFIF